MAKYNPGPVVTVGDLEVGDTIFLSQRRNGPGLPAPITPARVTALAPLADGRVRVDVKPASAGSSVPAKFLGDLPATREFRSAVLDA